MARIKRTEITIETKRIFIISNQHRSEGFCAQCGELVNTIRLEDAALAGVNLSDVPTMIDEGRLHLIELPDRTCLICVNSLSAHAIVTIHDESG